MKPLNLNRVLFPLILRIAPGGHSIAIAANWRMSNTETEKADYLANLLTRLYIFALSGVAILIIAGQVIIQQSIFKNGGDARVVNIAGRQRMFSQRIAKCAEAIDYADNAETAKRYTKELDRAIKQCTEEHEALQTGADNLSSASPQNKRLPELFAKIEPDYQTMIKAARAIIARQRAQTFSPDSSQKLSTYTETILSAEPVLLNGLETIVDEFVNQSNGRTDDLAQTEISLLLATLLCLLLLGTAVFRPVIDQIKDIIRIMEKMQNRLDGTISSMGEGLMQTDKTGAIVFANRTFESILGYKLTDIYKKNVHEILHHVDDGHARACPFVNATMLNDSVELADDVFRRQDGSQIPVQLVSSPVMQRGERTGSVITFRDVTEQLLLQRRLNAQHVVTRLLQEAASVEEAMPKLLACLCDCLELEVGAVFLLNKEADALQCICFQHPGGPQLDEFEKMSRGYEFERGKGLPGIVWQKRDALYIPDLAADKDMMFRYEEAEEAELKAAFAFPIMQSQKVLGVITFFGREVRKPDNQLLTLLGSMGSQIGEFVQRRLTEATLRISESRLNAIINSMAEGVIVADIHGSFLLINQAARNMHRTSSSETSVSNWTKLFGYYAQDRKTPIPNDELPLLRAIHGESIDNMEIFLQPSAADDGLWISCTARPLRDPRGELVGGIVVLNDITERKAIEKRLSVFYSTVSHELRTPLTSIKAALGLLEGGVAGELSPKAMQLVNVGREESDRLVRLINDILDVKKMEDDSFELYVAEVDLPKLIENSVAGLEAMAGQSKVKIKTSVDMPSVVCGDRDRLTQVLYNLIANAIKYSPENGTVYVKAERMNDVMRISVTDEGCGIPEDQVHLLFGMFQQLKGEHAPKPGTGLGLAICKKIVELHNGKIGIESGVNEGSTFWFELPMAPASAVLK